jgi:hypothetical protein
VSAHPWELFVAKFLKLIFLAIAVTAFTIITFAAETSFHIRQFSEFSIRYGLSPLYYRVHDPVRPVRVAILDDNFNGYEHEIGKSLTRNTRLIRGPVDTSNGESHGLVMAQIFTAFATDDLDRSDLEPDLYLIEASGLENFKNAIDQIIKNKIDVVVSGRVFALDSNESAFMNAEVDRAISQDVVWVNTAGNFGITTFNFVVGIPGPDGFLPLDSNRGYQAVYCVDRLECSVRLSLLWADPNSDRGDKNLYLQLYDENDKLIAESEKHDALLKRETIEAVIPTGRYNLRIRTDAKNFYGNEPIRIVADGYHIRFDRFDEDENLLTPADNPHVITVGAMGLKQSSVSLRAKKPEVFVRSQIETDDTSLEGSAVATAILGAHIALLKALSPQASREQLLVQLQQTGTKLNMTESEFADITYAASKGGYKIPPRVVSINPPKSSVAELPKIEPVISEEGEANLDHIVKNSRSLRKYPLKHPSLHANTPSKYIASPAPVVARVTPPIAKAPEPKKIIVAKVITPAPVGPPPPPEMVTPKPITKLVEQPRAAKVVLPRAKPIEQKPMLKANQPPNKKCADPNSWSNECMWINDTDQNNN